MLRSVASPSPAITTHRKHARQFRHQSTPQDNNSTVPAPPDFAFAFDIDGVLLRSSKSLPGASSTLRFLNKHSIPFILLTNGGGKHETERVAELSSRFDVPLSLENFVQSHTPFQEMVNGSEEYKALKDKTIFVTGNDQERVRDIAYRYGFKNVVTPGDILTAHPNIWPFAALHASHYSSIAKPLPPGPLKIDAIFVFSDPHDWALDTQIILDLLLSSKGRPAQAHLLLSSKGELNTYSAKNGDRSLPNNGWLQDGQPKLIFSNPDLFWATSHPLSRLGQGGFRAAFQGVWDEVTDGAELTKLVMGKPTQQTYLYSERVLQKHRVELLSALHKDVGELKQVFMIGDNPESDIRGANNFKSPTGTSWDSILVKTGVWQEGKPPKYEPKKIVDNVQAAVKWALKKQGYVYDEAEFADEK
ncbi:hypothetical protein V495_05104 [Pseudogymnoascus sp. VKM F-4514 (FW-929)]|nr:hypothetical protein V495_05104 [Pseudogymnoascus sp. VKM F-4514 (FW-929)]